MCKGNRTEVHEYNKLECKQVTELKYMNIIN